MRKLPSALLVIVLAFSAFALLAQEKKTPPKDFVFTAKTGNVTFSHASHVKAVKGECSTCHPAIFPQSRAPIEWKAGMHKPAETAHKSCGFCHHPGGQSFGVTGNCAKCHVKS